MMRQTHINKQIITLTVTAGLFSTNKCTSVFSFLFVSFLYNIRHSSVLFLTFCTVCFSFSRDFNICNISFQAFCNLCAADILILVRHGPITATEPSVQLDLVSETIWKRLYSGHIDTKSQCEYAFNCAVESTRNYILSYLLSYLLVYNVHKKEINKWMNIEFVYYETWCTSKVRDDKCAHLDLPLVQHSDVCQRPCKNLL